MGQCKRRIEAIANIRVIMERECITIEELRKNWFVCEPFMDKEEFENVIKC